MYLLRINFGDEGSISIILRLMQPALIVVLLLWIFTHRVRVDAFSIFLSILYGYGFFLGLMNGFSPINVVSGSIHYIQGMLIYIWAINEPNLEAIFLQTIRRLRKYYVPILTLAISYIYISNFFGGTAFYIGIATQALIPLFFFSLAMKRSKLGFFVIALTLLSGKRSVLVAILSGALLYLVRGLIKARLNLNLASILVIAIVLSIFVSSLNVDFLERLLVKFDFSGGNLDYLSAGRTVEVVVAFSDWLDSPALQIFGSGFGDTYVILPDDPNGIVSFIQNIHFSYGNSALVFGATGSILLHVAIFVRIWRTVQCIRFGAAWMHFQQYTLLAHLVLAIFSLTLYADPIFWMLIAYGRVKKA